ncbi:MAG: UvrD-helicase domain-containing protein [Bacteroidetes bacterium]|nr:UvrD-helicase domain-containing protein [Bacteroidota bacterium]
MNSTQHNFVIYKSSAGSGKTFTLVKEYLKLALSDTSNPPKIYKSILAITFTNKAAAEMKERILNALRDLSAEVLPPKSKTLSDVLCAEVKIDETELRKRSTNLLYDILHNYGNFGISTIDSFTHSIIRNFSHDIDLPVNFNIEMNEDEVITKCIDQLISKIGEDEALTKLVLDFSREQTEDQKSWQVDENIKSFVSRALRNSSSDKLDLLKSFTIEDFKNIRKELIAKNKTMEVALTAIADKFYAFLSTNGISEKTFHTGQVDFLFFRKIKNKEYTQENLHGARVMEAVNEDKWCAAKSQVAAITSNSEVFRDLYYQVSAYLEKHLGEYIINQNVLRNLYSLSLINEIDKLISAFKEEENILFISEFNKRIADVISTEPVPFIYEKIGERYKHFLIDEFQDTSAMQWQNLLPLIDNSLAEGHFNLLVGDGKQSIYRWRGGEAGQFESLPKLPSIKNEEMREMWEDTLERNTEIKNLENNFRSLKNVVEFNNQFFTWLSGTQLSGKWKDIYAGVEQKPQEKNQGGYITIDVITKEDDAELAYTHMLKYVHHSIESGFNYSEIVVLVRGNTEGNNAADFLTQQGIPVISSDSLLLKNCSEVVFITDVLAFLNDPHNAIRASSILCYLSDTQLMSGKTKDEFLILLNKGSIKYNLINLLKEEGIKLDVDKLVTLPLLECCIEIIAAFKITKNKNYLQFFLDEIIAYTAYNSNSINAFLEAWIKTGEKASLKIPEGSEAVRIMTIHKSKGLEFPVVIIPFCNWKIDKSDYLWLDAEDELPMVILNMNKDLAHTKYSKDMEREQQNQLLDNINVLYVAFTRAADHLHIVTKEPKRGGVDAYNFVRLYMNEKLGLAAADKFAEIGTPKHNTHKKADIDVFPYHLQVNNWNRVISIKENSELLLKEQLSESKELGVLIHYILSKINTVNDIDAAVASCEKEGLFAASEASEIASELKELLTIPTIAPFFAEGLEAMNEQEVMTASGKVLRPDRLILKDKHSIIVDFKTGKQSDAYDEQLNDYANALQQLGYDTVDKYLVYVKDREVVKVN